MRLLYYFYYRLYQLSKLISDDFLNEVKPFFILIILQFLFLVQLSNWYTIITYDITEISRKTIVVMAVVICVLNYIVFLYNDQWKKLTSDFQKYSQSKSKKLDLILLVIVLLIIITSIYSYNVLASKFGRTV
jgi:hypothetical protein